MLQKPVNKNTTMDLWPKGFTITIEVFHNKSNIDVEEIDASVDVEHNLNEQNLHTCESN